MSSFKPIWDQGHLGHRSCSRLSRYNPLSLRCAGFHGVRNSGVKATEDGWLNRSLHSLPVPADKSAFRAIAMGPSLPRILSGSEPAVAINNISDFGVGGRNPNSPVANTFEAMYSQSVDTVLHGTGQETFEAVKMLKAADPTKYTPAPGANYPRGRFGEQPAAVGTADQSQSRSSGCVRRYRRMGPPRQRGQHAGPVGQCAGRFFTIALSFLDRPWRFGGRHGGCHHVRIWSHSAGERQSRH